jgi:DNA repair protein SbcC/Rad50
VKLRQLEILTLPGIEPRFAVRDIAPGVNLVTGPNGVGKSSLARALRYIAVIAADDPKDIALAAVFENGGLWTVRRTGSHAVWERDGVPVEPPSLPDGDVISCCWLSMDNLLAANAGDERLVTQLRRSLAGGFDLRALRGGPFEPRPRAGQAEAQRYAAAVAQRNSVASQYQALQRAEAELPRLAQAIAGARAAADLARRLDQSLVLLDVLRERQEIEAGLASFPMGMRRLRGDELDRLDGLERKRQELATTLEAARRQQQDAQAKLAQSGLGAARPENSLLEAQEERIALLYRRRDQLADRRNELSQAQAEEDGARAMLGGGQNAPQWSPEAIARAEHFAAGLQAKQRTRDELAARMHDAGEAPPEEEIVRHQQAAEALRDWLTMPGAEASKFRLPWVLAILGGVVGMIFGALAGALAAAAGGAFVLAAALWALLMRRSDGGADARRRFADSGLDPPASWQRESVRERLAVVDQALAGLRDRRERAAASAEDGRRLERAERELRALDQERSQLALELGFDPCLTAAGIDHFVRYSTTWRQAADRREGLERTAASLQEEIADATATAQRFLQEWKIAAGDDPESLRSALQGLRRACRDAEATEMGLNELAREIGRLEQDRATLEEDESNLYAEAGLDRGARDALKPRLEQLEAWRAQGGRLADAERRAAEARQVLAGQAELLSQAEGGERDALLQERDEAHAQAAMLESLQERSTEIRTRLQDAGIDRRLEQAAAETDAAREQLWDRREDALFAEAGQFLLDEIEQEYRSEHQPAVLADARERFVSFTHHSWDVELDEDEGWIARDLQQGVRRGLTELSSGTRMQLLLAVRLAWIRSMEQEHGPFPLILDEALTTSDESRFASIAKTIQQLASAEGRQVFYLSARHEEVALWERATGKRPHHIDLAEIRFGKSRAAAEDLALAESVPVPSPGRRTPEEYAVALGVPPLDPQRPEGAVHIFHLLRDDLTLLHRLVSEWRIATLGQLEELLASSAACMAIAEPDRRRTLACRCTSARTWIASWRQGRGRPVNRIALESSGLITDHFLEQTVELAISLDGDASSLLHALREGQVRRFRKDVIDQLEAWLVEERYIDRSEMLDEAGRERRALLSLDGESPPADIRQLVAWLEAGMMDAEVSEIRSTA